MRELNASIITIGDELLIGQTIDTNSAYIGQELNRIGIWVKKRIAIGDVKADILRTLEEQSRESQIVIITGGLGPTADDITKPALCEYFGAEMVVDEGALENVRQIFLRLNRPLIERNLKQGEVPGNCIVLPNRRGTAPGMWFDEKGVVYVSLPGVPNEMRGLMQDSVLPRLAERFVLPAVVHRTLLTSGVGESTIADAIESFENALPPTIKLAYLPSYGLVRLRLTCRDENAELANKNVDRHFEELKNLVEQWMVADEDIPLEEAVNRLLQKHQKTLGTAESCTGGYIAHLITSRAGSSASFRGSVVSYHNEIKTGLLSVKNETLAQWGAVSEQTVAEMAAGALNELDSDYVIATSGIMGPGGGSEEKPVGTVWMAVANRERTVTQKSFFRFDRTRNIEMTAYAAMTLLFRFVKDAEGG